MDALDAAHDTLRIQPSCRRTVYGLCHGVVERVVHALLQPEPSTMAFLNLVDTVVAQRRRIPLIREEGPYAIAVIAVQSIACTQPDISSGVTDDAVHHRIRQSLTGVEPFEFHIRYHACAYFCYQTEYCHQDR